MLFRRIMLGTLALLAAYAPARIAAANPTCLTIERALGGTVADTYIADKHANKNYGSADKLVMGKNGDMCQSLLRFDLGAIPAGSDVNLATVTIHGKSSGLTTINVHEITASWSESSVTWASFAGAFSPSIAASFISMPAAPSWATFNVTSLVQKWVSGQHPNYGILLDQGPNGFSNYDSSEGDDWGLTQPKLFVCFTPQSPIVCGDGIVKGAEACDDGNTVSGDGCSASCSVESGYGCSGSPSACVTTCGDGIIAGAEACDDGNAASGDGCSASCKVEGGYTCGGSPSSCATTCGDGVVAGAEACDDGNAASGDGCSASCKVEGGYTCGGSPSACATTCGDGVVAGAEACDDGNAASGDGCSASCKVEGGYTCGGSPSSCATTCGDGVVAGAEACDDGNLAAGDGCSASCAVEGGYTCGGSPSVCATTCGDGVVAGAEACDDGNLAAGDGCGTSCSIETGYTCDFSPSVCAPTCGDGVKVGAEACDDGNSASGDGCSAACAVEAGFTCGGAPSVCTATCGDGIKVGAEACDDGNGASGDGCSAVCAVEAGFTCNGSPSVCTCTNGVSCDDGNLCTKNDVCGAGACAGTPVVCAPPDACHQAGACDAGTGTCTYAAKADGSSCTNGACQAGQCIQTQLSVTVYDRDGDPIANAKVKVGNKTLTTGASGEVVFSPVAVGNTVAKVTATGYSPAVVNVDVQAGAQVSSIAHLLNLGDRVPFEASSGLDTIQGNVRVAIPGDAVIDGLGNPVTGVVEMTVAPLDPSTDLDLAPGPMVGLPQGGNQTVGLASVFMADITLWSGSNQVKLKPGATATVEFTLPDALQAVYAVGDQIDAWSFDLNQGIWVQEGTGMVGQSLADPSKLSWIVDVPHFTWWNADFYKDRGDCLQVKVVRADTQQPITSAATVSVASLSNNYYRYSGQTDSANGQVCIQIPSNDVMRVTASNAQFPNVVGYIDAANVAHYGTYPQITTGPSQALACGGAGCKTLTLLMGRQTCIAGDVQDESNNLLDSVQVVARFNSGAGPQSNSTLTDGSGHYCVLAPQGTQVLVQANYDANGPGSLGGLRTAEKIVPQTGLAELACNDTPNDSGCTPVGTLIPICDATCATWAYNYGDGGLQSATDVAVDANGNIFVTGYFSGTMTNFGNAPFLASTGYDDIYVAKIDPNGQVLWKKSFGDAAGAGIQQAYAIAVDSLGNPVIVGSFTSAVTFGPGATLTSQGGYDGFVTKLSGLDGSAIEARRFGGAGNQWLRDVIVDNTNPTYSDSLIVIGDFTSQIDCSGGLGSTYCASNGGSDIFLAKIFGNSFYVWSQTFGGAGDEHVMHGGIDASYNLVMTGDFNGGFSFGAGSPTLTPSSSGTDVYAVKMPLPSIPWGAVAPPPWAKAFGAGGCANAGDRSGVGIAFDRTGGTSGNVWLTGDFSGCVLFSPPVDVSTGQAGTTDGFVARLDGTNGNVLSHFIIRNGGSSSGNWQHGSDITVDTDGALLLTGTVRGAITFGGATLNAVGAEDLFVAKLSTSGAYLWASRYGGGLTSYASNPRIAVKPYVAGLPIPVSGDVAITGTFLGNIDFDAASGIGVTSNGNTDVFVAKVLSVQ